MRLWLILALVPLAACARRGEENLGLTEKPSHVHIDLSQLTRVPELDRALSLPSAELDRALGPHRLDASASVKIQPAGKPLETLDESFRLDSDAAGSFHLVHDNSHERGMEAFLVRGALYVRPRYGKFVRRRPEPGEPARLRAIAESALVGYLRVLEPWLAVRPTGPTQFGGHHALRLQLAAAPSPAAVPTAQEPAKRWRDTIQVKDIRGEILLDAQSGAPLSAQMDATYSCTQASGNRVETTVHVQQATTPLPADAIHPPSDFVESPIRPRPVLDRQVLLDGLGGNHHER